MAEYQKTLVVFTSLSSMKNVMPRQDGKLTKMSPADVLSNEIENFSRGSNLIYRVVKKGEIERADKIERDGVYLVLDSINDEAFRKATEDLDNKQKEQVYVLYHKNQGGVGFDDKMLRGFKTYKGWHSYTPMSGYSSFFKALPNFGDSVEFRGEVVDSLIQAAFCYNARIDTALDFLHKCLTAEPKTINLEEMLKKIGIEEPEQGEIRRLLDKRAEDDQWLRKVRDIVLAKVMHA